MNEKEKQMAQPPETMTERGGLNLEILDGDERVKLIGEICQELTLQQLKQVRELADQKRLEKIDEAKEQVIARMREEFAQLDLDLDEVMGLSRVRRRKSPLPPKYRSPEGKEWSGRGYAPVWIREYEAAGGDREDYLIKEET